MQMATSGLCQSLRTLRAAEQERPDVAERRAFWRARQVGLDPERLVFLYETWATTSMTRLRGRALRGARVLELVPGAQAELVYLPPYSPDLNPIELAFSKIKQALRSLAARTVDTLWSCTQGVLDRVTGADAAGFFQHCGYTLQIK